MVFIIDIHNCKLDDPPKHINYYDIDPKPLNDLLEGSNRRFHIDYENGLQGSLAINCRHILGRGAAKTTHSAILSVLNAPSSSSGLGHKPNEPVVAKRFYYIANDVTGVVPKEAKIMRYSLEDERRKVEAEANLLYWADSLMSLANSWIQAQIAQRTNCGDPCPLNIPKLRFVRGGVASVQGAYHKAELGKLYYQPSATYIIEEPITSALGEFTKYVHNVDATPQLPSFDEPAYEIAEFLCFVQHLQYWKTDAMVYISDFQGTPPHNRSAISLARLNMLLTGAGHLLTDPQIMTNPYVLIDTYVCNLKLSIDHILLVHSENFYSATAILRRLSMSFLFNTCATSIASGSNCHLCRHSHWQPQMCKRNDNLLPINYSS